MQVYRDITPPTAVSHCVSAALISPGVLNLAVVKASSLLQIYDFVVHESSDPTTPEPQAQNQDLDGTDDNFLADIGLERSHTLHQTKLVLVAEFELNGFVTGISRIRTRYDLSRDCLLLSFASAKLSLIAWDPFKHKLTTISLHYYEKTIPPDDDIDDAARAILRTDPGNFCACLKFGKDMFAFLPFKSFDDDDYFSEMPTTNGFASDATTPLAPTKTAVSYKSFVVDAHKLDDSISNVIDLVFLYEYREPTLAILYEPKRTWTGLLHERQDSVSFIILSLDLQQRASTPIFSVSNLPYDLQSAVPLPAPIGGTLLLGANEVIHVDPAGRAVGIAVNSAALMASKFDYIDRAFLELRLEGARATYLQDNFVLFVLGSGEIYLAEFALDGRTLDRIEFHAVEALEKVVCPAPACIEILSSKKKIYIGSGQADSLLLSWRKSDDKSEQNAQAGISDSAQILSKDYDDEDEELYGGERISNTARYTTFDTDNNDLAEDVVKKYIFSVHDTMTNYGPLVDLAFGAVDTNGLRNAPSSKIEIVGARAGEHHTGGLSIFRRSLTPRVVAQFTFPECKGVWTVKAKSRNTKTSADSELSDLVDKYLIISKNEESLIFDISEQFDQVRNSEFDSKSTTLAAGVIFDGTRIVQICPTEIHVYDSDLQISQMLPVSDDDDMDEREAEIVAASFSDQSLLVLLDNGKALYFSGDVGSLELAEGKKVGGDVAVSAGCLAKIPLAYVTAEELKRKRKRFSSHPETDQVTERTVDVIVITTSRGILQIYNAADLSLLYSTSRVDTLPEIIHEAAGAGKFDRPSVSRRKSGIGITAHLKPEERDYGICEILYAPLGDSVLKENHLIIRTADGDIAAYKPFMVDGQTVHFTRSVMNILRPPVLGDAPVVHSRKQKLFAVSVSNLDVVAVLGGQPVSGNGVDNIPSSEGYWIVKTAKSTPKSISAAGGAIYSLSSFHSFSVDHGFIYVSNENLVRICRFDDSYSLEGPWPAKKIVIEEDVHAIAYHPVQSVYVISTSVEVPFSSKDEPEEREVDVTEETEFPSTISQGSLKLISPKSWVIVDNYELATNETALVVRTVNLQLSERLTTRRQFIAVGTGVFYGEDQPSKGFVYVFEIIEVVPEPGRPEHNHKFKLIVKEDVRGVASTLCELNGYLLSAQGQKVMVRALREDNSFLPVAFMDMNIYVSEVKCLKNVLLLGDVMKSIWFVGFSEEPYKMQLFGKDLRRIEVVAADFCVNGEIAHFVIADANKRLHVVQYDPEDPKSLSGQRLMPKSEFFVGHNIEAFVMVPQEQFASTPSTAVVPMVDGGADSATEPPQSSLGPTEQFMCIGATRSGSLIAVHPVSEAKYRRLVIVQQHLTDRMEHVAGLNPRMHRTLTASSDLEMSVSRAVLDGNLLMKFASLSLEMQLEIIERVGKGASVDIWNHLIELDRSLCYM
ncbi:CPSF A subunit region-domain-containing protein [Limtongia smithiae]|uniref:CPSF A subunit region-domain-containing protein n=1 Tax=Limtongia smithiae TaxID=1125753 RepID=UPI0034CE1CFB